MDFLNRAAQAKRALKGAESILIGAGAGLSDAAGMAYGGKRFTDNFAPFINRFGITDMYSAGFYPFPSQEEKWAYWARHILINRYDTPHPALYLSLLQLIQDKYYFVITTNVDGQFVEAGFPSERVFAAQGDYRFLQCAQGCHDVLYDNESLVKEMVRETSNCRIPSSLVPKCPVCGGSMEVNLRCDEAFIQNGDWHEACNRYYEFTASVHNSKLVLLELGVGYNTPGIIRYPFERMAFLNENAALIRLNRDYPDGARENANRTVSFTEDMREVLKAL